MSKRIVFILLLFLLVMTLAPATYAAPGDPASDAQSADPEGVLRLEQATDGEASVTISSATGAASFVRLPADENAELLPLAEDGETVEAMAMAFFSEYGGIFGITDPRTELRLEEKGVDTFDLTHLVYYQFYRDVPVFAADLRVHFDAEERLTAVNGVFIPDLNLDPHPSVSAAVAEIIAVQTVAATKKIAAATLTASPATLYVFRQGLVQGGDARSKSPRLRSGGERPQCAGICLAASVEWSDTGAAADTSQPTFYLVRGINACGEATTNSDETGAFNFSLTPGDS